MPPPKNSSSNGNSNSSSRNHKKRRTCCTQHHHLPTDIIIEILSYLPATTLLRFRCVSRSFHSLLSSDPRFALLHACRSLLHSPPTFSLSPSPSPSHLRLLSLYSSTHLDFSIPAPHPIPPLFAPSLGLVLSVAPSSAPVVLNPLTGHSLPLPAPPSPSHPLGFGLDPSSGDFKALILPPRHHLRVSVCSLRSPRWRAIPASFPRLFHRPDRNVGLYHAGALHWSSHARARPSGRHILLSFDLAGERFRTRLGPPLDAEGQYGRCFLAAMAADLGFVIQGMCGRGIEVWRLVDDEEWRKEGAAVGALKAVWLDEWGRAGSRKEMVYYDCRTGRFELVPLKVVENIADINARGRYALLTGSLISPLRL